MAAAHTSAEPMLDIEEEPMLNVEDLNRAHLHIPVVWISVSGIPQDELTDAASHPLIHWRVHGGYYHPEDSNLPAERRRILSVCLDTAKDKNDIQKVETSAYTLPYMESNDQTAGLVFNAITEFTVTELIEKLINEGRYRYTYNGDGSGCLFWSMKVLSDVEGMGWISPGSAAQFCTHVQQTRAEGVYWIPEDDGTFY